MTSLAPSRALALLTLVLLQGCYFFYPTTLPKLPGPTIVDGGRMEVSVRETTAYTMCFKSDLQAGRCVWHRNDWAMERTRYTARASYAGRELTQGEFYLLTRDGYPAAVKKIQSRKGTCNISLVPSVIAFAGAMFATVVLASGDRIAKSDDDKLLLYGAGAGTFALGAGGRRTSAGWWESSIVGSRASGPPAATRHLLRRGRRRRPRPRRRRRHPPR